MKNKTDQIINIFENVFNMEDQMDETFESFEDFADFKDAYRCKNEHENNVYSQCFDKIVNIPETLNEINEKALIASNIYEKRKKDIMAYLKDISLLCEDLDVKVEENFSSKIFSLNRIEQLIELKEKLKKIKLERENIILTLSADLKQIWNELEVPEQHRSEFISSCEGRSIKVIQNLQNELESQNVQKQHRLQQLLIEKRKKIEKLWDTLQTPASERTLFESKYNYSILTVSAEMNKEHDQLLTSLLEKEIILANIQQKIKLYLKLKQIKVELDSLLANPLRLTTRNSGFGSKHFEKENKMKEEIKNLPVISEQLKDLLNQWKDNNNSIPLLYDSIDYLEIIEKESINKGKK